MSVDFTKLKSFVKIVDCRQRFPRRQHFANRAAGVCRSRLPRLRAISSTSC